MTRKDYVRIAWELRQARPETGPAGSQTDLGSDYYAGSVKGWEDAVLAVASALAHLSGSFDSPRFFAASGLQRRPDGSMYPAVMPKG